MSAVESIPHLRTMQLSETIVDEEEAFLRRGVGLRAGARTRAPVPDKENFVIRKLGSGRIVRVLSSTTSRSPLPSDYPRVPLQDITSALKRFSASTRIRPRVRVQGITPLRQLRIHESPEEETAAAYDNETRSVTAGQENVSSPALAMLRELLADEDTVLGTDKAPLLEEIQSAAETEELRKEKSTGIASEAEAKSARRDNATGIAEELRMKEKSPIPSACWHIPSRNIQQNRGPARHSNLKPLMRMR